MKDFLRFFFSYMTGFKKIKDFLCILRRRVKILSEVFVKISRDLNSNVKDSSWYFGGIL